MVGKGIYNISTMAKKNNQQLTYLIIGIVILIIALVAISRACQFYGS